ncbi:MAG: sugar phosphate isomerase/epimerase family protein [Planctomycetota bacterium]
MPDATPPAKAVPAVGRLALHTKTLQRLSLAECVELCVRKGIAGLSVWRDVLHDAGVDTAARLLRDAGLAVPALVRGGFFVHADAAARRRADDDNRRCLDEASALGADMVVLVVGSGNGVGLAAGREQVRDAVGRLLVEAETAGVRLAVEPLHPMYAADKSCINRLRDANDLCDALGHPSLGVAVDVYHTWWDPDLDAEIARAGRAGRLFGFHLCDWRLETRDLLLDRELMGRGCIPLRHIGQAMRAAGFDGFDEVEIFSEDYWAMDPPAFVDAIRDAYATSC